MVEGGPSVIGLGCANVVGGLPCLLLVLGPQTRFRGPERFQRSRDPWHMGVCACTARPGLLPAFQQGRGRYVRSGEWSREPSSLLCEELVPNPRFILAQPALGLGLGPLWGQDGCWFFSVSSAH